ncbi:MAG TPA: YfbK domain-containing protein [Prosthecobacter sp.]
MNPQDNPHFTAYALGELSAKEARELHEMLAAAPGAAHELEQIEAVTDALRHGAPIPQARLTHEQRHAVLHPASLPRRIQPMQPRKPAKRSSPAFWSTMGSVLKAAAVVALSGAAFLAGWAFSPVMKEAAQIAATPPKTSPTREAAPAKEVQVAEVKAPVPPPAVVQPKEAAPTVATAEPASQKKPETVRKEVVVVAVPTHKPAPTPVAVATSAPVPAPAPVVAAAAEAKPDMGFAMAGGRGSFASTTKQAADLFSLHPGLIKPAPSKAKGGALASPLPVTAKPEAKPARISEVYIHSWQSEVATCPWNPAHRLLRLLIQLPADQPAVLAPDAAFPLQVNFDQANVKQYRMLGERHLPAAELRTAGMHVLWYEFQPNGAPTEAARDRLVATVTLPNARFTSQAVGPFDSSKLQVIDRGFQLQNAREEFVFEASVLGFGMLMRGTDHVGSLNHSLVLDLAKKAKGADGNGERARFIRVVQDAQRVAGL